MFCYARLCWDQTLITNAKKYIEIYLYKYVQRGSIAKRWCFAELCRRAMGTGQRGQDPLPVGILHITPYMYMQHCNMYMHHSILLHTCICNIGYCAFHVQIENTLYLYVFVRCPCQWSILCIGIGTAIPYLQMCYFWTYVCTYINHRWWTIINPNLLTKCAGKANCLLHVSPFNSDRFGRGLTDWDLIRDKSRPESIQI